MTQLFAGYSQKIGELIHMEAIKVEENVAILVGMGLFIIFNFFQEVGYIGFGGGDYMVLDDGSVVNWSGGFSGFQSALLAIPTIALVIGIIMILGGLSLAFVLWKNGKKRG